MCECCSVKGRIQSLLYARLGYIFISTLFLNTFKYFLWNISDFYYLNIYFENYIYPYKNINHEGQ